MASYLIIDKNQKAANLIEWDGQHDISFLDAQLVPFTGTWDAGWAWAGGKCVDPNPPPPQAPPNVTKP